jgi:hypothetical protein
LAFELYFNFQGLNRNKLCLLASKAIFKPELRPKSSILVMTLNRVSKEGLCNSLLNTFVVRNQYHQPEISKECGGYCKHFNVAGISAPTVNRNILLQLNYVIPGWMEAQ